MASLVSSRPLRALFIKQEHRFESCNKGQLISASRTTKSSYLARFLASPQDLLASIWSKQFRNFLAIFGQILSQNASAVSKPCCWKVQKLRTSIFVDYRL